MLNTTQRNIRTVLIGHNVNVIAGCVIISLTQWLSVIGGDIQFSIEAWLMTLVSSCLLRTRNNGVVPCEVPNGRVLNQFNRSLAGKIKHLIWCQGVDRK